MPKFYFDWTFDELGQDDEGVVCADASSAKRLARQGLGEWLKENIERVAGRQASVQVRDTSGAVIYSVAISVDEHEEKEAAGGA